MLFAFWELQEVKWIRRLMEIFPEAATSRENLNQDEKIPPPESIKTA